MGVREHAESEGTRTMAARKLAVALRMWRMDVVNFEHTNKRNSKKPGGLLLWAPCLHPSAPRLSALLDISVHEPFTFTLAKRTMGARWATPPGPFFANGSCNGTRQLEWLHGDQSVLHAARFKWSSSQAGLCVAHLRLSESCKSVVTWQARTLHHRRALLV